MLTTMTCPPWIVRFPPLIKCSTSAVGKPKPRSNWMPANTACSCYWVIICTFRMTRRSSRSASPSPWSSLTPRRLQTQVAQPLNNGACNCRPRSFRTRRFFQSAPQAAVLADYAHGKLQRLFIVEPWINRGLVGTAQATFIQRAGTTGALGHVLAGQLQVDTAKMRAAGGMHIKRLLNLPNHVGKAPRLDSIAGGFGVAVHGVAHPQNGRARGLDRFDQRRQLVGHLVGAHAVNQHDAPGLVVGVERAQQPLEPVSGHAGAHLDTHGVAYSAEHFNMGPFKFGGAHAYPQKVGGQVEPAPLARNTTGQCLRIRQVHRLR